MTRFLCLIFLVCSLLGCKPGETSEHTGEDELLDLPILETSKPMTDERNKATVYDEPLWDEKLLEKQMLYCVDQYIDMEEIDPYQFCSCFLSKARYTHQIDFLHQAFEDQDGWMIDCMKSSPKQDF